MFSVVVPVYNHARYVESAVLSALQSRLVTEVLVVDDGSYDASAEVIDRLARSFAPRVHNLGATNQVNLGAHKRLNQLCRAARSDWIAVLNSDDEFVAGRFETLSMVIRATKSQFVCGSLLIMGEDGRVIGAKRGIADPEYEVPHGWRKVGAFHSPSIRQILCNQNFIATTSNMVFHKDVFRWVGGFSDLRYVHDWEFALRATMFARCTYMPSFLSKYRIHRTNTISEPSAHADGEVVRFMTRILEEFPQIEEDAECRLALAGNRHLGQYVPPQRPGHSDRPLARTVPRISVPKENLAAQASAGLPGCFALLDDDTTAVPWVRVSYLHAPMAGLRLPGRATDSVVLSLAHFDYDFVIVSETLEELPTVRISSLINNAFFNERAAPLFLRGETPPLSLSGRIIRLQPAVDELAYDVDLRSVPGFAKARFEGADIFVGNGRLPSRAVLPVGQSELECVLCRASGGKPLVLVMPIFLAVGGVERNMVEILRQLQDSYEFVVITTERLSKHQGSLHYQLDEIGVRTFDLAEIGDRRHHIMILETLARLFQPAVVWICNGSPWLVENSSAIRRIFCHVPIIDQEVYDDNHGWINHYTDRGIQSFDRFIAINQRIRTKFLDHIRIPEARVDLIYHAINSKKFRTSRASAVQLDALRLRYGIPGDARAFAFIGRLTDQKRPLDFLGIAKAASENKLNDHFLLVGDGELKAACDSFISDHDLSNITCIRFSPDPSEILNLVDGIIITSMFEGLPVVFLEALALGRPVLATDVGDIRLILDEFGSGKIIPVTGDFQVVWETFIQWRMELDHFRNSAERHAEAVLGRFSAETIAELYHRSWVAGMAEYATSSPELKEDAGEDGRFKRGA